MKSKAAASGLLGGVLLLAGCGRAPEPAAVGTRDNRPQVTEEALTLPRDARTAFAGAVVGPAVAEVINRGFAELCADLEVTDPVEQDLLALPRKGGEDWAVLGYCYVKPSPASGPTRVYERRYEGRALRYARVIAPASEPLAVILARTASGKRVPLGEYAYDGSTRAWRLREGRLEGEVEAVRVAVGDALRRLDGDAGKQGTD